MLTVVLAYKEEKLSLLKEKVSNVENDGVESAGLRNVILHYFGNRQGD